MDKMTEAKLMDICDGNLTGFVSLSCDGYDDTRCPYHGCGCVFARVPTVSFESLWRHIERSRPCSCDMPIDSVLDKLMGC